MNTDEWHYFNQLLDQLKPYWRPQSLGCSLEPEKLQKELALEQETQQDWPALLNWIQKYLDHSIQARHPRFLNRMWSEANLPSILAEIVIALSNVSAGTYESAPVATLMEHYMVDQLLRLVGFERGEGQMSTGSSQGNLIAMLAARNRAYAHSKDKGLWQQSKRYVYASADAHYSIDKAVHVLGIGTEQLIKIPVDAHGRMDMRILEQKIKQYPPLFIVATLGTTVRGAYDAIPPLLELKQKYDFWLHGDGAWGGAALFDKKLRALYLTGLEHLDSFTLDFHKMLGSNLMCNLLLFNRSQNQLRSACSAGEADYLFRQELAESHWDTGPASLQCGQKIDSLKLFLDWKFYGQQGFGQRVRHYWHLIRYAEKKLGDYSRLQLVVPLESFNLCFRYLPESTADINGFNLRLRDHLFKTGQMAIGVAYIQDQLCFRLLITHPDYQKKDIDALFNDFVNTAQMLDGE